MPLRKNTYCLIRLVVSSYLVYLQLPYQYTAEYVYSVFQIQDINELPRREVDEIIKMCVVEDQAAASSDNIQKRYFSKSSGSIL